ncbi:hypothetical protein [Asaia astilbis]
MRKETLLVIGFLALVLSTVAVIWSFALPALRPLKFETLSDVTLTIEQTGQTRALNAQETGLLNHWLQNHKIHWAPLTSPAPSTGDVVIRGRNPDGGAFEMALWTGVSGADWNNTAITRVDQAARLKKKSFSEEDWADLRHLIDGQGYDKSTVP